MTRSIKTCFAIIYISFLVSCGGETSSTENTVTDTEVATTEDPSTAMETLTKDFETAYNNEDAATLKTFFTADAVRVDTDNSTITGNEEIAKAFEAQFAGADAKVTITNQTAERQADGTIHATGIYQVTGKTSGGEAIDIKGNYDVIDVEENGKWKISKQKLTLQ